MPSLELSFIHKLIRLAQTQSGETKANKENQKKVYNMIVKEAAKLVRGGQSKLFVLDEKKFGEEIKLIAIGNEYLQKETDNNKELNYKRGEDKGPTGYIFKTGEHLCINDLEEFKRLKQKYKWPDKDGQDNKPLIKKYLGVPIKSQHKEVIGVLEVSSSKEDNITREDLKNIEELAMIVSIILYGDRERKSKKMLFDLGAKFNKNDLFEYVVQKTPELILGRGCSIFLLDEKKEKLELAYTNSQDLKQHTKRKAEKKENILKYEVGKGKTGFAAKLKSTLIINRYGRDEVGQEKLASDYSRYDNTPDNKVKKLYDEEDSVVGLLRLHRKDSKFTKEDDDNINKFLRAERPRYFRFMGKSTDKFPCETGKDEAISFLSLPIMAVPDKNAIENKEKELLGVLRIPRTFEGSTFTDEDVVFVESIIDRLTLMLEKERFLGKNLHILKEIDSKINSSFEQDDILRHILEATTKNIGFDIASIQLVDNKEEYIETVAGLKKIENNKLEDLKWKGHKTPLNPGSGKIRDVHAWVLMELEEVKVIKDWDDHFNKEIYDVYDHANLIRAFVPIMTYDENYKVAKKIGTLEAGYNINKKDYIDDTELMMLKALANQAAIAINKSTLKMKEKKHEESKAKKDLGLDNKGYLIINTEMLLENLKGKKSKIPDGVLNTTKNNLNNSKEFKQFINLTKKTSEKYVDGNRERNILHNLIVDSSKLDTLLYLTQKRYRDHYKHQFLVGALGWFLLDVKLSQDITLRQHIANKTHLSLKNIDLTWWATALLHDHGYPLAHIIKSTMEINKLKNRVGCGNGILRHVENLHDCYHRVFAQGLLNKIIKKSDKKKEPWNFSIKLGLFESKLALLARLVDLPELTKLKNEHIFDHGIVGVINIINLLEDELAWKDDDMASFINDNRWFQEVLVAIALHNSSFDFCPKLNFSQFPIAYLLKICDELQEWDRITYNKNNIESEPIIETGHIKIGYFDLCNEGRKYLLKSEGDEKPALEVFFEYPCQQTLKDTGWDFGCFEESKIKQFSALGMEDSFLKNINFEILKSNRIC